MIDLSENMMMNAFNNLLKNIEYLEDICKQKLTN